MDRAPFADRPPRLGSRRRTALRLSTAGLCTVIVAACLSHAQTNPTSTSGPAPTTQDLVGGSVIGVPPELLVDAPQLPPGSRQNEAVERVLIISIDGMRPDVMLRAAMPTIRGLMDHGSFTMYARTTDRAVTSPSHASMLTGVTPEVHGVTFNNDPPDGATVLVPTLFDLAKARGLTTGMASSKSKFSIFTRSGHIDSAWLSPESAGSDEATAEHAAAIVREHRPQVMFVHFAGADVNGHGAGWGSPEQLASLAEIDRHVGEVLAAYDQAGIRDGTLIIVSADHGGTGRSHGPDDPRSRYIPWIATGPGIRQNFDLTRLGTGYDVATYDTFATACDALGLPIPEGNDGHPISVIYERNALTLPSQAESRRRPADAAGTDPTTIPVAPRRGTTWPVG